MIKYIFIGCCFLVVSLDAMSLCVGTANGVVQGDEICDPGPAANFGQANTQTPPYCNPATCTRSCEDGTLQAWEQCDKSHAGSANAAACLPDCTLCGNGIKETSPLQQCDRSIPGYDPKINFPCSNLCKFTCGVIPGVQTQFGQKCEPKGTPAPPFCNPNSCQFTCGNQILDNIATAPAVNAGQQCDRTVPTYSAAVDGPCNGNCLKTCGVNGIPGIQRQAGQQCEPPVGIAPKVPPFCSANCQLTCGNTIKDTAAGQQCDPTVPTTHTTYIANCLKDCTLCGNGVVDTIQQCDPTSTALPKIPCDSKCKSTCGNGIIQKELGQTCEFVQPLSANPVPLDSTKPCSKTTCTLLCGNGLIDGSQQCDPAINPTTCGIDCKFICGNGKKEPGQQCEFNEIGSVIPCSPECKFTCGNGKADLVAAAAKPVETCDLTFPGNTILNCDKLVCKSKPTGPATAVNCGDGILTSPQQCQPILSPDCIPLTDMTNKCKFKKVCGNGRIQTVAPAQVCDDGNRIDTDSCSNLCTKNNLCGNSILDAGEQCDYGTAVNPYCDSSCKSKNTNCGNGVANAPEQCDDGNKVNGDGCNALCFAEPGYICKATGPCTLCGNGKIDALVGQECDDANNIATDGCNQCKIQILITCGNGVLQSPQQCDDGNAISGDGCNRFCRTEPGYFCDNNVCTQCGDGKYKLGQDCDDGNRFSGDGCSSTCKFQPNWSCTLSFPTTCTRTPVNFCTDGKWNPLKEQCDDGNSVSIDGCDRQCQITLGYKCDNIKDQKSVCYLISRPAVCGNGIWTWGFEQCDDSNTVSGDGCSSQCRIQAGYECSNFFNAKSVCTIKKSTCGNSVHESRQLQECDDGNIRDGDGCSSTCQVEDGWECIDNIRLFSSCTPKRTGPVITSFCGDGSLNTGEQCDDKNTLNGDGCSSTCKIENYYSCVTQTNGISKCTQTIISSVCGDRQFNAFNEECDDGNLFSGDGCDRFCKAEAGWDCSRRYKCIKYCGNGKIDAGEQCDDSNFLSNDGCSSTCKVETLLGYSCSVPFGYSRSVCTKSCGNSKFEPSLGEACDDGNTNSNDGCSSGCKIQDGYTCKYNVPGDKSFCTKAATCGNRKVQNAEQCDDGNLNSNDGCSADCRIQRTTHTCSTGLSGTVCYNNVYCPSRYPLPEIRLPEQAIQVLSRSIFAGYTTYSQLVKAIVTVSPSGATINKARLSELTTLLNSQGQSQVGANLSYYANLCAYTS